MELQWSNRFLRLTDPVTGSSGYAIFRDGACMVIDPNSFGLLQPVLEEYGAGPQLVLLTHEHCDHIGGLNRLRERYRTVVAASRACSCGIQDDVKNMSRRMELFLYYKNGETKLTSYPPFVCRAADLTFEDAIRLPFGTGFVDVVALPGHTRGSSVIFYDGILFSGDYLLPEDQVETRLPGGSREDYETCARPWLSRIPDGTWIAPGHGRPFQMDQKVRKYHGL